MTRIDDPTSFFKLEGFNPSESITELSVKSQIGRIYELQTSRTLKDGSWTVYGGPQLGNDGLLKFEYPTADQTEPQLFFRIRVRVP